jgi:YegS/Rv2252/BmrU family lipid kinase
MTDEPRDTPALERRIKSERRAILIVNTHSRRGARLYVRAKRMLLQQGVALDAAYPVRHPERTSEVVKEVLDEGHRFIIVGGGDGTISAVVDHFVGRAAVLGILPLGTANSFARSLEIGLSLTEAIEVLTEGRVADIDLGRINDDYFANTASLGLPAAIARAMRPGLKRYLGRTAYLLAAGWALWRHRPFRCTLSSDGQQRTIEAFDVLIANGPYHGGVPVVREAGVGSRDVVIQVIRNTGKRRFVATWLGRVVGLRQRGGEVELIRTRHAVIDATPPQYVVIDGEVAAQTPISVSIAARALKIMVPRDFADGTREAVKATAGAADRRGSG